MRAYGTGQAAMQRGTICESPLDLELRGFIWRQLSPDPCQASWRRGRLVSMSFTCEKNPCTHKMRGSVGCGSQGYCKVPTAGLACSSGHPGG